MFSPIAFEAQIEFQKDASGKVTGLTLKQNGRTVVAPRTSDTIPPQ